jgi:hypothetical protein
VYSIPLAVEMIPMEEAPTPSETNPAAAQSLGKGMTGYRMTDPFGQVRSRHRSRQLEAMVACQIMWLTLLVNRALDEHLAQSSCLFYPRQLATQNLPALPICLPICLPSNSNLPASQLISNLSVRFYQNLSHNQT